MADDGFSASELRQRYQKGGKLKDNELTAAQVRARYDIDMKGKTSYSSAVFRN